jgi:hypothetical protein
MVAILLWVGGSPRVQDRLLMLCGRIILAATIMAAGPSRSLVRVNGDRSMKAGGARLDMPHPDPGACSLFSERA